MSDLFLKYKKERENVESISVDGAFITYKWLKEYCYIEDVYCIEELRDSGIAHELAEKVAKLAKAKGYKKLLGSVDITAANPEISLRACFNQGFKILNLQGNVIWLHKEI